MPQCKSQSAGRRFAIGVVCALLPALALGETFTLPPEDVDLVGELREVRARHEDTLLDIARRYDLGQEEILLANRGVDRWLPGEGARVLLPSRYVLPQAQRRGVVLNIPEMRLYHFPPPAAGAVASVTTYPVSIGRMDWATPLGVTRVAAKQKDPAWRPPASIRQEAAARGEPLPASIPPGPDNPLGRFALRLGLPGYLIHGTNRPFGVGMRVTHGCVRLYPEDIEALFPRVPVGTPVQIVNQPVKAGWFADTLFLEVHPPLDEDDAARAALADIALDVLANAVQARSVRISGRAFNTAVAEQRGIPVPVSVAPP